jgi:D-erythronate 2-dehydrogenase
MHVLVIGASGFVGRKLVARLVKDGEIGEERITRLTMTDVIEPDQVSSTTIKTRSRAADITDPDSIQKMLNDPDDDDDATATPPDVIFHLAAIVSGAAEMDFELGYKVNVDGTRLLLDAIKNMGDAYKPRLVFSSSMAVYGPPIAEVIPDDHATTPRSSYGTQKAIAELLMEDYTRKGFVDGVSIRFPTIAIRPGKPNKAVSSFISGIIREPLHDLKARLPVDLEFRHPVASPNAAVGYLLHAATLKPTHPEDRTLNMPSICLSVKDMMASLEKIAGKDVVELIQHDPDPFVNNVVKDWPRQIEYHRAMKLGFRPDGSYEDIIKSFMKDEGLVPSKKRVHDEVDKVYQ